VARPGRERERERERRRRWRQEGRGRQHHQPISCHLNLT